jgi:isocitrate lyase
MIAAFNAGKTGAELQAIEDAWTAEAGLKLFDDAVVDTINRGEHVNKKEMIAQYLKAAKGKSNSEARAIARGITGVDIYWDWDLPRTREGYYRLQGGCACAINRAIAYAPYADAIWMESKLPDYAQAEEFAKGVHAVYPEQKYVSPDVNLKELNANPRKQIGIQPITVFQLEDRYATRRARNLH